MITIAHPVAPLRFPSLMCELNFSSFTSLAAMKNYLQINNFFTILESE